MKMNRKGPDLTLTMLRRVAPILALASLVCIALAFLGLETGAEKTGLVCAMLLVLGAQLCVVGFKASQLKARITKHKDSDSRAEELLRLFPTSTTLHVAAAGALVGPISFIAVSSVLGLGPGHLLLEALIDFLIAEVAFLFPVFFALRGGIQSYWRPSRLYWPWRRGSLTWALFPVVAIPAVCAALGLVSVSDHAVNQIVQRWLMSSYGRIAESVFSDDPAAHDSESLVRLTRFDSVTPFTLHLDSNQHHGISGAALEVVRRVNSADNAAIDRERNAGFVWMSREGSQLLRGIRVEFPRINKYNSVAFAVFLAVIFTAIALTLRYGTRLKRHIGDLNTRIDALPERGKGTPRPGLPGELEEVMQRLDRLEESFHTMRAATREAIDSGRRAGQVKSEFFAGMSHDLRSPLNSIIGFTDLLLKGMEGPLTDEQQDTVHLIAEEAEKLMVLVADILDTSKLDSGSFELNCSWVPAAEVLTECVREARRLIGTQPIELLCSLPPDLPLVLVDKERIRQAIISLLARVVSAVRQGTVEMRASLEWLSGEESEKLLRIVINDADHLVPIDERRRIETAFHSIDGMPSRSEAGGLGLGISLARDMVRLHGGELNVVGSRDVGTIFSVTLPLDDTAQTE